ncbi:MAG: cytochrome c [Candidatus Tumulicola sp.]
MRGLAIAVVALAGSVALGACAKSNNSANEASSAPESTPATSAAPVSSSGASPGATTYTANCASCHQPGGKGLAGSFPPLAGNPVVSGDAQKVIHIVKYGLSGKIMVGPDAYNGMMPPWGTQLSDDQIAGVITYIRSSWGNGASPVSAAEVAAVKK